jgi:hypothetical protein
MRGNSMMPCDAAALQAVDRHTLKQLRGSTAKGYAFDKVYSADETSDGIYDETVASLVENCFKVSAAGRKQPNT